MKKTFLLLAALAVASVPGHTPAFADDGAKKAESAAMSAEQLEEMARAGDLDAAVALGIYYEEEEDDARQASKWFEMAANGGNVKGMHRLGLLYRWGKGVPTNGRKAEAWFLKAANQNYGPAQSALGEIYMDGYVLPQDEAASVKWYSLAAQHGDRIGEYFIGMKYMHGDAYTEKDYNLAAQWLTRSADQGYAKAQANLGVLYQYGYGVQADAQKAYQLFLKSAQQGDTYGEYMAGTTLLGQRDPNFFPQGFEFIKDAAEQGFVPAMKLLPDLYQTGKGTPQSAKGAYKWHLILYDLTPTTEKQTLGQIKAKMHNLGDYMTNQERAQAKAAAEVWLRKYKQSHGYR